MVAVGVMVGTVVKVGSTVIGVLRGMTPAVVGVGDGDWVAEENIGKLQANIMLTETKNATILKIRIRLSFESVYRIASMNEKQ